jgi:CTP synthase
VPATHSAARAPQALLHASFAIERKLKIKWVDSSHLDDEHREAEPDAYAAAWETLRSADGVLVPGGFGIRAVEGKCAAAKYARENRKPYLGICLGFQVGVIEFARSVLGLAEAHSAEFDEATPHPLIVFMPEVSRTQMGGTMRLGSRRTVLRSSNCKSAALYGGVTAFDVRQRVVEPQALASRSRRIARAPAAGAPPPPLRGELQVC